MAADVLLIGSGGREHALAWKLSRSPSIGKLYIAPGNGGTAALGENVPIGVMEFEALAAFALEKKVDLTVVGPDDPLAAGITDLFRERGLLAWGPGKAAARIEGSKAFAKEFMAAAGIPTAEYKVFSSSDDALAYVRAHGAPIVVKASGLALGKGVYVCRTLEEAEHAIRAIMVERVHKDAGSEVVIEAFLEGREFSVHALSDGTDHILFPPSQDHKRALEGDEGEQTGGMGTIAPVPWVSDELMARVEREVVSRAFDEFHTRGVEYKGVLYPGVMLTAEGPQVLEFNARFGDPECQAYMRLLKSDLFALLEASAKGELASIKDSVEWSLGYAVNIVIASGGYPGAYRKGMPITGIEDAERVESVVVFHAGTAYQGESLVTNGGRVLGVSATGETLKQALERAYEAAGKIHFEGMHYRKDIGAKAL